MFLCVDVVNFMGFHRISIFKQAILTVSTSTLMNQ